MRGRGEGNLMTNYMDGDLECCRSTNMHMHELKREVMSRLASGDTSIGNPITGLVARLVEKIDLGDENWPRRKIAEAISELISVGLVYVSFADNSRDNRSDPAWWILMPTERGRVFLADSDYVPEDKDDYLRRFLLDVPDATDVVRRYIDEALESYRNRCYLACAVMLGVASEAMFFEMAEALSDWDSESVGGRRLAEQLGSRNTPVGTLIRTVREIFDAIISELSPDLKDGVGVQMVAVVDLIRNFRNEAGHPSGKASTRETCLASLMVFPAAATRMLKLKAFFSGTSPAVS